MIKVFGRKVETFWKLFVSPPKIWRKPKVCQVAIYDVAGSEVFDSYLEAYCVERLYVRGEGVYVWCFLRALLDWRTWCGQIFEAYLDAFLRTARPKVLLTLIDNSPAFLSVSVRHPSIKTILIQNGIRGKADFDFLQKCSNLYVDQMFVFGKAWERKYKDYIEGECVSIGSFRNNHYALKESYEKVKDTVLFISQFSPRSSEPMYRFENGNYVLWEDFYRAEGVLLPLLQEWCDENGKKLQICGRVRGNGEEDSLVVEEKAFFKEILRNGSWEFLPAYLRGSYERISRAESCVFISSTLGLEALGQGLRTACFPWRVNWVFDPSERFGWPDEYPDEGVFWASVPVRESVWRVMDSLYMISEKKRMEEVKKLQQALIGLDRANIIFRQFMAKEIGIHKTSGTIF